MAEPILAVLVLIKLGASLFMATPQSYESRINRMQACSEQSQAMSADIKDAIPSVGAGENCNSQGDDNPSPCSGCSRKKSCAGCVDKVDNESAGWTSLDALPSWDEQ